MAIEALACFKFCINVLARIVHTPPAAAPETGLSPALRSGGLPRRTSSTPRSSDLRAPWIQARLRPANSAATGDRRSRGRRLATDGCEICGLAARFDASCRTAEASWPPRLGRVRALVPVARAVLAMAILALAPPAARG